MAKLRWTLFDRRLDGLDRVSLPTAMMVNYPRLWKVGVRELPCQCRRRNFTRRIVLYRWKCPTHMAWALNHNLEDDLPDE